MATPSVKNSQTGAMGTQAAKRTRYEKMETAFGQIPAEAFDIGDTLSFDNFPMKELIHAKFKAGTTELEIFSGADLTSAVRWDLAQDDGLTADIDYVVEYIRGTGLVNTAANEVGDGEKISLWVVNPDPTVVTVAADTITDTGANLKATVDPNGAPETVITFEWGTETEVYTEEDAADESPLGYFTTAQAVDVNITGLDPETEYFYRVKAVNAAGTFYGDELSFETEAA